MTTIFVIAKDGAPLMPTTKPGKVRRMLKDGRAKIYSHRPFTIQLTYDTTKYTQPIEFCCDTGDHHVGVSLKSEKKEYISDEYRPLKNEKYKHDNCREARRNRRNRKRYRKARFNNRKNRKGKLPPSIEHKVEVNLKAFREISKVCPIEKAYFETAKFDIQKLAAIEKGGAIPEGEDYQQGACYNFNTLRDAVFARDNHTCQFCGKGVGEGVILRVHHALYWQGRHGNQLDELATCCTSCHTPKNHAKGGKLWGYKPKKFNNYAGATIMNQMRKRILAKAIEIAPDVAVLQAYGADTKAVRKFLGLEKSHVNDAYCMGEFHPGVRASMRIFQKSRRNNRILETFRDAKYIDSRDGVRRSGKELFNGRTTRNKNLNTENLHKYRSKKVVKGHRSVRRMRYDIRPGDIVIYDSKRYVSKGCRNYGRTVRPLGNPAIEIDANRISKIIHSGGYMDITAAEM